MSTPQDALPWSGIDALLRDGRASVALALLERAVSANPDDPAAWFKLGQVQMTLGVLAPAAHALSRSAQLVASHSPTWQNLGLVAMWMGQAAVAEAHFRRSLALDASNVDARFGLATALLKQRKAREGWALYAAGRAGAPGMRGASIRARRWDGGIIGSGALLVLADQGLGDVLQFARFLASARARAPRLVVFCADYHAPLAPLLATVAGVDAVVDRSSGPQAIGAYADMSALPHLLQCDARSFESVGAYMTPPPAAIRRWAARVRSLQGLRIGVCWAGNPRPDYVDAHRIDLRRSLRADELAGLAQIPGASFVSLQKGTAPRPGFDLVDWTGELRDYAETAALIANLDLVVSVDTSIVHCAGAVGTPVWMLDRFDNCWRWGEDELRPGWYERLRVFRQPAPGAWGPAIERMLAALSAFVGVTRTRTAPRLG
jgi:tetratricopeptide (TPR) repeat protein